jgi:hypothetical protein
MLGGNRVVKRNKGWAKNGKATGGRPGNSTIPEASSSKGAGALASSHAPVKNPTLLGISVLLFVLWFAFLLVTALFG